jgi:hypothetical protein
MYNYASFDGKDTQQFVSHCKINVLIILKVHWNRKNSIRKVIYIKVLYLYRV